MTPTATNSSKTDLLNIPDDVNIETSIIPTPKTSKSTVVRPIPVVRPKPKPTSVFRKSKSKIATARKPLREKPESSILQIDIIERTEIISSSARDSDHEKTGYQAEDAED